MSRGDLERLSIIGRPVKPVAFGLSIFSLTLLVVNMFYADRYQDVLAQNVMIILAFTALTALVYGWLGKSQSIAELGLVATGAAFLIRGVWHALTIWPDPSIFYSFGLTIIAWGAFLLERIDDNQHHGDHPDGGGGRYA